jgi:hypothetical protein
MNDAEALANLLSDIALGSLALWQGFVMLSDVQLRRMAGLGHAAVEASLWYKLRKLDGVMLMAVVGGFSVAIVLRIMQLG